MGRTHITRATSSRIRTAPRLRGRTSTVGPGPIAPRVYGPGDSVIPRGLDPQPRARRPCRPLSGRQRWRDARRPDPAPHFYDSFPNSPVCDMPKGIVGPVVARFDQMSTPFQAIVWGRVLPLETFDQAQVLAFYSQWGDKTNPEPQCTAPSPSAAAVSCRAVGQHGALGQRAASARRASRRPRPRAPRRASPRRAPARAPRRARPPKHTPPPRTTPSPEPQEPELRRSPNRRPRGHPAHASRLIHRTRRHHDRDPDRRPRGAPARGTAQQLRPRARTARRPSRASRGPRGCGRSAARGPRPDRADHGSRARSSVSASTTASTPRKAAGTPGSPAAVLEVRERRDRRRRPDRPARGHARARPRGRARRRHRLDGPPRGPRAWHSTTSPATSSSTTSAPGTGKVSRRPFARARSATASGCGPRARTPSCLSVRSSSRRTRSRIPRPCASGRG